MSPICNCGKPKPPAPPPPSSRSVTQEFALRVPGQPETRYGSRLEADAANVRAGRRGEVKPARVR